MALIADTSPPSEFDGELVAGDYEISSCSNFVRKNVVPALGKRPDRVLKIEELRSQVRTFVKQFAASDPIISYDYPLGLGFFKAIVGDIPAGYDTKALEENPPKASSTNIF
ncbi:hypothetical protein [Massilia psychrophila]|uniref:hypothetical protein n=1 Tax=Massilia psychrophila TaxID=1603353 RepID=UPI001C558299|nr:hypothetical protein [Massilia psychrophila]